MIIKLNKKTFLNNLNKYMCKNNFIYIYIYLYTYILVQKKKLINYWSMEVEQCVVLVAYC